MSGTLWDTVKSWFAPRPAPPDFSRELRYLQWNDEKIMRMLNRITERQDETMSKVDDLRSAFDEATSAIAARIERILQGQDDAIVAQFTPVLENLRSMGQDPENPVPSVPPVDGEPQAI